MPNSTIKRAAVAAAAGAAVFAANRVFAPWHRRWGTTDSEVSRRLPGDELIEEPGGASTRAVSINATPIEVWNALMDLWGVKDGTMPMAGGQLTPEAEPYLGRLPGAPYIVVSSEALKSLVLRQFGPAGMVITMAFVIEAADGDSARLLVRTRMMPADDLAGQVAHAAEKALLDPMYFLAERRLLRRLKHAAESA